MTKEDVLKRLAEVLQAHRKEVLQTALKHGVLYERTMSSAFGEEWLDAQIETAAGRSSAIFRWASSFVDSIRLYNIPITAVLRAFHEGGNDLVNHLRPLMADVDGESFYRTIRYMEDMTFSAFSGAYAVIEEQTSASTRRVYRLIADSVERPFVLMDLDGQISLANSAFARLIGRTEDDLTGQNFHSLCDKDTITELRREFRSRRPGPAHKFTGMLCPYASGILSAKPVEVHYIVSPIFDNDGFRSGLAVTLEQSAETPSLISEILQMEVLIAVANVMGMPILFLDADGHIPEANDAGKMLDLVWESPEDTDLDSHVSRLDAEVFATGEPYHKIMRAHLGNGNTCWMEVTCFPIYDAQKQIVRIAKMLRDLSAQRMLEEQLLWQQHTSLMSQLAITVAHQLRNPLGVIVGFAEMLSNGMPTEQSPTVIDAILRNGIRCRDVVQKLLEFGRGTPGEHTLTDINLLLTGQVKPLFAMMPGIQIEWQLQEELPPVICASEQLVHVFACLIDNAIKATATHIWVETRVVNHEVQIWVRDNGPGIPEEIQNRIFDPFFTTRSECGCVGLGLSLSLSVIQEHRGVLQVEPSHSGACFCVKLPAVSSGLPVQEVPSVSPQNNGHCHVLIVEDEQDLVFLLKLALQARGCHCDTAATVASALDLVAKQAYDMAIVDMVLKDESSGRDLYRAFQKAYPALTERTIFITGDTAKYETRRFLTEVKCPYLEKPFMLSDFLSLFQEMVSSK